MARFVAVYSFLEILRITGVRRTVSAPENVNVEHSFKLLRCWWHSPGKKTKNIGKKLFEF